MVSSQLTRKLLEYATRDGNYRIGGENSDWEHYSRIPSGEIKIEFDNSLTNDLGDRWKRINYTPKKGIDWELTEGDSTVKNDYSFKLYLDKKEIANFEPEELKTIPKSIKKRWQQYISKLENEMLSESKIESEVPWPKNVRKGLGRKDDYLVPQELKELISYVRTNGSNKVKNIEVILTKSLSDVPVVSISHNLNKKGDFSNGAWDLVLDFDLKSYRLYLHHKTGTLEITLGEFNTTPKKWAQQEERLFNNLIRITLEKLKESKN